MTLVALKPTQQVVDIVGALGGTWRGYLATCRCPAHQDKTPSLSVRQGHKGIPVHCFASCDADDFRFHPRCPWGPKPTTLFPPP